MGTPYATVILPTFNRDATLPYALGSIQAQSRRDIEILLVLDGATALCRSVALAAAADDARIRVLDLAKSPPTRPVHNDFAVRSAASERIFYIDDDDLFLPGHVETLGPMLDDADIVDSRVGSADLSGGLNLGVAMASSASMRLLLGSFRLKMLYDTHIAHRKDAYDRLATWLPAIDQGRDVIGEFLAGFANNPSCRWVSHLEVTAVSLHGAARRHLTPTERQTEIARWAETIASPIAWNGALAAADASFNLLRLLVADRPATENLSDYLRRRGAYEDVGSRPDEQRVFGLFCRIALEVEDAIDLAAKLAEPVEAGSLFETIAQVYWEKFGAVEAARILQRAAERPGNNPGERLAALSAALARTDTTAALDVLERAIALGPDPLGSLPEFRDRLRLQASAQAAREDAETAPLDP